MNLGTNVHATTVELFASARATSIGQMAFATSSQQLFIRVNNGWKEVLLGGHIHPSLETKQSTVSFCLGVLNLDSLFEFVLKSFRFSIFSQLN